jgi:protein AATF/BFR2
MLHDTLIEWRIRIQKLLLASNRLPQPHSAASSILNASDTDDADLQKLSELQKQAKNNVSKLIQSLNSLQDIMMEKGFSSVKTKAKMNNDVGNEEDDEEIPSDDEKIPSDDDEDVNFEKDDEDVSDDGNESLGESEPTSKSKKRKRAMKLDDQDDLLQQRFDSFTEVRNDILDEWYNKTRFATEVKGRKGMESFEQPPTAQIRAIVSDKKRLLRRTQLKRSDYEIIGKVFRKDDEEGGDEEIVSMGKRKDDNYDTEIFDDDDFYHQLLRELIANKTSEGCDSLAISKKWLEIQKMRSKMKKKIDPKERKGRKVKFETHKELVNFMAPVTHFEFTEEAKDELFASLFQ